MKTLLKFIGLFDHTGKVHGVELDKGLNLITGRSSTGKSSLIEIFDYCMGSSEDTIPHGVIKENAYFYFLWMQIKGIDYLLGRDAEGSGYFLVDNPVIEDIWKLDLAVFDETDLNKDDYLIKIGLIFGIDATTTAETAAQLADKRKGGQRPSIRNMMPFILQHQNLVANKQALFYRFDQKEKREETIDQFKVFAGFVDANYYAISIAASRLREKIEQLKKELQRAEGDIESTYNKLVDDIKVYGQITGNDILDDLTLEKFKEAPEEYKEQVEKLDYFEIKIDTSNTKQLEEYRRLEQEENSLMADLREKQIHLEEILRSIEYIGTYKEALEQTPRMKSIKVDYSVCPFCHQHTTGTEKEAQSLLNAINSLNEELRGIPTIIRPLHEKQLELEEEIESIKQKLDAIDGSKAELSEIIEELKKNYSLKKQAYKTIFRITSRIELVSNEAIKKIQASIKEKKKELEEKYAELNKYDLSTNMNLAYRRIRQEMAQYRKVIKFEPSLDDYSLVFDLNKFELFFEKRIDDDHVEKKYLRAIGSGANWLNAHLCLFLALADFFHSKKESTVPSILFLDQPSQVYFPAQKDKGESFDAAKESVGQLDDDLASVNTFFSFFYKFCKNHNDEIQIVVTDHADNLTIEGLDNFGDIVKARWRKEGEGLIDLRPKTETIETKPNNE